MMNDKETWEEFELAEKLLNKMMNVLFEEKKPIPSGILIYLASKLSAKVICGTQIGISEEDSLNKFMGLVKQYIEIMKEEGTLKSFDNEIARLMNAESAKETVEEFKREPVVLGKEIDSNPIDDDVKNEAN